MHRARLVVKVEIETAGEDTEVSDQPGGGTPVGRKMGDGVEFQRVEREHCSRDGCGVSDEVCRGWFAISNDGQNGIGFEIGDDECCVGGRAP